MIEILLILSRKFLNILIYYIEMCYRRVSRTSQEVFARLDYLVKVFLMTNIHVTLNKRRPHQRWILAYINKNASIVFRLSMIGLPLKICIYQDTLSLRKLQSCNEVT